MWSMVSTERRNILGYTHGTVIESQNSEQLWVRGRLYYYI